MSTNQAEILYFEKYVHIKLVGGRNIMARGKNSGGTIPIIFVMKAHKCLARDCEVFLAHLIEGPRKKVDVADMEVVREFRNVFRNEFPSLLPP